MVKASFARLSPLAKDRICGMREAGWKRADISKQVKKNDGKRPCLQAVDGVLKKFEEDPEWDGCEERTEGGRPRDLTQQQEKKIRDILLRDVGRKIVSATSVKRSLPELRRVADRTIQRTFQRLGFAYKYRRKKAAIGEKYKPARLSYCDWLLKQSQEHLNKFAYIDGTTFFLPRTEVEQRDKQRACLGPRGWRLADGSDSMEDKNVGPSAYAKSQGNPVRMWGLFCNGRLEYWVLPEEPDDKGKMKSVAMTGERYHHFISTYLAKWRRKCLPKFPKSQKVPLVKDHEGFLRWNHTKAYDNLKAERDAGFSTVTQHPKCSADLNAIEGWWRVLQLRLFLTAPVQMESRAQFLKRLRRTVAWLNNNARAHGKQLCTNQKERARAVKKLLGAKCKW